MVNNAESERVVCAAVLRDPGTLPGLRLLIDGSEFDDSRHGLLWAVMCDLADAGTAPDPATVVAELGRRRKLLGYGNGAYIATLYGHPPVGDPRFHVAALRDRARVRGVERATIRLRQALDQWEANGDTDALLTHAAEQSLALTLAADAPDLDAPVPGVQTWEQFCADVDTAQRWIVPGLIRRHDTIMILGAPGVGKSYLSRMVAMCLAAGIHPFKITPTAPVRTLLVDLENAPDQVAEEAHGLLAGVRSIADTAGRGFIWPHPEGLNLRDRADAALLERVIIQTEPQVLCMGSLYNAYRRGRDDWDTAAEDVQAVLKRLRSKYGLGLWLEHHMPRKEGSGHTGTPFGGTAWERWPTHGRWLRRDGGAYRLAATFRGDRGERDLPAGLTRGGRLPWSSVWDEEQLRLLAEGSA